MAESPAATDHAHEHEREHGQNPEGGDRLRQARLEKLARLEDAGIRPYPTTFPRSHRATEVQANFENLEGKQVCVAGRLGVFKSLGKNLAFVFLQDDSGQIQLILHPRALDEQTRAVYAGLDPGDFVGA